MYLPASFPVQLFASQHKKKQGKNMFENKVYKKYWAKGEATQC
jgi:hypothetical protein